MHTVYIEKKIIQHPRSQRILEQLKPRQIIECDHYQEVFNSQGQNFRIQKQNPALILAEKKGKRILQTPPGFGIGGLDNYYFSHMLNCLYDCRYCFLQSFYNSAHYVLFVNYEDFMEDIHNMTQSSQSPLYFFSGYDCDSLAMEPISRFIETFIPFFHSLKNTYLELRTKSSNVSALLKHTAYQHCIVAFSFTPDIISKTIEHKVPSVQKRLQAMKRVAEQGWPIGLRLDPLIYHPDFINLYRELLNDIFKTISPSSIHSVSLGPLRFPDKLYQKLVKLYPHDPLLASPLYRIGNVMSYRKEVEQHMKSVVNDLLNQYIHQRIVFECHV